MPLPRLFGRPGDGAPPPACARATAADRPAALASLLGTSPSAAPTVERRAEEQGMDLSLLWTARQGRELTAAALLVPHAGRTALLMTTPPRDAAHADAVSALVSHVLRETVAMPAIRLVQALCSPGEPHRATAWTAGGMVHLASLDSMERPLSRPIEGAPHVPGIRLAPWDPNDRRLLEELLPATYVETLDCPGLARMRTPADIVDGHLASGQFDPRYWTIAFAGNEPVGALLLTPSPSTGTVEVVYLGLVPSARGRGLGRALLAHGIGLVAGRTERTVALAVDARNTPAVALYARTGFRTVRRREAFVAHPAPYPAASAAVK